MVLELVTVLLGVCVGVVAVLYAAPKGYLGHPRRKTSIEPMASLEGPLPSVTCAPTTEQAVGVPATVATTVAEPAPSPVTPIYETVQPAPAPVQYSSPSTISFGAPSISKPTRTYRRRTAPVRSTAASKASLKSKTKKR